MSKVVTIQKLKEKKQDSDTETEYCRLDQARAMLDKSVIMYESVEKELIEANRRNTVVTELAKNAASKLKQLEMEKQMLNKEIENLTNKDKNRKTSTTLTEHKLFTIAKRKDNFIKEESSKITEEYRKQIAKELGL